MAKMTKEQAVSGIQAASTHEAIEAVLMNCTKAVMVEAGAEELGLELKYTASQKKADMAHFIASLIENERKAEVPELRDLDTQPEAPVEEVKPAVAPTVARFVIGKHYEECGVCDPRIYTYLGMCSRCYGVFVDSLNIWHKAKIKMNAVGTVEMANSLNEKGSPYGSGIICADHEVPEHEIVSFKNGTSILLNAETVIHSADELERALAPKPAPVENLRAETCYPVEELDTTERRKTA